MSQELDKTVLIGVWLVPSQSSLAAAAALEHLEEDLAGEGFTGICRLQFTRDVKKLDGGNGRFWLFLSRVLTSLFVAGCRL